MEGTATELKQFVDGRWLPGSGDRMIVSDSPARPGLTVAAGAGATPTDVDAAVVAARAAVHGWAATPAHERGGILQRAAAIVASAATAWGAELALEEGKTRAEGIGEVRRAAQILAYFGNQADAEVGGLFHSPRRGERIIVTRRPLGTVGLITPFNFPIAIPAWKLAPALAYGNTAVWKPAGSVPLLAMRLTQAFGEAGLPAGVLNLLIGDGSIGAALAEHQGIDAISFTGSTQVGRSIAAAGALRGIPVQAEMGGKNAAIVLADADLALAAGQVIAGAFNASGQKCTATSRLLVANEVADEFLDTLVAASNELVIGDPLDERVNIGPLITAAARDAVVDGIDSAIARGARRLTASTLALDDDLRAGYFVRPTILDCSGVDTDLWHRELFGPVLAVRRSSSADEAFAAANDGVYGLSAAVFTDGLSSTLRAIDELDVGMLHINSETAGADPHVPFGGAKASGLGPKEQGQAAREFFTHTTTVYLRGGS